MDNYWQAIQENKNISVLVLLGICLISFIPNLGVFDPALMEARNFVTAREMVEEGNWLLPTMNGEYRLAKPPLPTWITAITMLIIGNSENVFALRLPAVFAGIVLVLSIYLLVFIKTKSRELAFITGAVSATSLLILQMSRTGSWDIHCHTWMIVAITSWVYALKTEKVKMNYLILSAFFMGLSFLSKGPVSFYTILIPYIIASLIIKDFSIRKLKLSQGILYLVILIIVSSWWPVYVYLNKAEIGMAVMKTEATSWTNRHVRPFYFYFHFPIYIGIWTIPLLASFFWKYAGDKFEQVKEYKFLIAWMICALILLSVIPEKKERYLLPLIIPMVLMCGNIIFNYIKSGRTNLLVKKDKLVLLIHCIAVSLFNLTVIAFIYNYGVVENSISLVAWVLITIGFLFLNYLLIKNRLYPQKILLLTIAAQLFIVIMVIPFVPAYVYDNRSFESINKLTNNKKINGLDLYSIKEINLKHIYAVGRKVRFINPKQKESFPTDLPVALISVIPPNIYLNDQWKSKLKLTPIDTINASRDHTDDVLYISILDFKHE